VAISGDAGAGAVVDEARRVVAANTYLALATADGDGRPWATPVWFAERDLAEFVWVSRPGARHSRNIAANPAVGIAVFDSDVEVGGASAVYVEGTAHEVGPEDRAAALAVHHERTRAQGIPVWHEGRVTGASPFRLYRARAVRVYVLDDHDGRVEVRG
jgi:nitroimidazol reductase NimA-like FMN-containing flavoprotein (pyridoxamine 5'-phosphate oxidase superfamily)